MIPWDGGADKYKTLLESKKEKFIKDYPQVSQSLNYDQKKFKTTIMKEQNIQTDDNNIFVEANRNENVNDFGLKDEEIQVNERGSLLVNFS